MEQSFTVTQELMTLNEYTRLNRSGYGAGASAKRKQQDIIGWHIKASRLMPIECPVHASFLWRLKDRRKDLDNVAFAQKFILDALVECGILRGDGQKHVVGFTHNFTTAATNSVTVTLQEVK